MQKMLLFIKQTAADAPRLPADPTELGLLSVEQFIQLEIPVSYFQEADVFQIHRARSTGTKALRNGGARNDRVWVQTGGEASYGDLRVRGVASLLALFRKRNVLREAAGVHRLALVHYSVRSMVVDFTWQVDIYESASSPLVAIYEWSI